LLIGILENLWPRIEDLVVIPKSGYNLNIAYKNLVGIYAYIIHERLYYKLQISCLSGHSLSKR